MMIAMRLTAAGEWMAVFTHWSHVTVFVAPLPPSWFRVSEGCLLLMLLDQFCSISGANCCSDILRGPIPVDLLMDNNNNKLTHFSFSNI